MRKYILIASVFISGLLLSTTFFLLKDNAQTIEQCPAGSYEIDRDDNGKPICKAEPTGCPYGDSIPMSQCDKYAPKPEPEQQETTQVTLPAKKEKVCQ